MKNVRDNTLKALILIALFSSSIFADGEMGGGGLYDSGSQNTGAKAVIVQSTEDGEMGGGGRALDSSYLESVMKSIYNYLSWTK
jgi:hypothetical protein